MRAFVVNQSHGEQVLVRKDGKHPQLLLMSKADAEPDADKIDGYYLIDSNSMLFFLHPRYCPMHPLTLAHYNPPQPSPLDNLLKLYGLETLARSLERTKSDGSKGVKLRKSYKNHIQDLPGKHQIPPAKPIPAALLDPSLGQQPDVIKELDPELLSHALKFDKTPINGIPGFNTSDLAISDQQTLMRGDDMSENDDSKKKRKKKQLGGDYKRPHA